MAKYNRLNIIDKLYNATLLILGREIRQLKTASTASKLSASQGRDLREYIKTLGALKAAQEEIEAKKKNAADTEAKGLSTAALEAKVRDDK